jgi:hypothetical protein
MIKHITGTGGVTVLVGGWGVPSINMNAPSAGIVRYNGNNRTLEVYDGCSWYDIDVHQVQLGLDTDTVEILNWARQKRAQEQKLEQLADQYPAVKSLKEKLDLICHIVESETPKQEVV